MISSKVESNDSYTSEDTSVNAADVAEKGGVPPRRERGIRVVFKDLVFDVRTHGRRRARLQVLRHVSGFLNPAEMTAVLGVSGAGKSTLLDCLAGRNTCGTLQGTIEYDGHRPSQAFLRQCTGYVEQTNSLISELSVAEMLMYTTELKRDRQEPLKVKRDLVERIIGDLSLQGCRNRLIGGPQRRGISGGEAKRTNVGIALVGEPRVLFLDEPTTGLDSYTGGEVMQVIKSLTSAGITLLASIHSPSPRTFALFDRLLILQQGRLVYFGGGRREVVEYFTREVAEVRKMADDETVAEFIFDVIVKTEAEGCADRLADAYDASTLRAANDAELAAASVPETSGRSQALVDLHAPNGRALPAWRALCVLAQYRTTRNLMSLAYIFSRIGLYTTISIVLIIVWWQRGDNYGPDNVSNIAGFYNFWVNTPIYSGVALLPGLVLERPLFRRETADGLYSTSTYLAHKLSEELLMAVAASVLLSFPVYGIVGLAGSAVLFWMSSLINYCISIGVAYFVAAVSPNLAIACMAVASYGITITFFLGLFPSWAIMPRYVRWYTYLNPMRYSYAACIINAFEDRPTALIGPFTAIEWVGVQGWSKWASLGYESLFFLLLCAATLVAMHLVRHGRR